MVGMRTRQLEQQLLSCWISSGCRTHTLGFLFYPPWYPPCPFTLPLFIYLIAIICDIIYSTLSPICNFFLSSRNIICPLTFAPRCCSVTQSCPTLCYPMDCSTPGFPVLHHLPELTQTHVDWIDPTPLLFSPSIFSSIRVFSNEWALRIRWPKYWSFSFSFSISPSNEYSGLISFRMEWLDLLAVQGTLNSLLQHHSSKASVLWCPTFFIV